MSDNELIAELSAENEYLKSVIEGYKKRETDINSLEENAKKKAAAIEKAAEKLFNLEADRLRLFKLGWDKKFARLSAEEKEKLSALNDLAVKIDEVIGGKFDYATYDFRAKTQTLRRLVDDNGSLLKDAPLFGEGEDKFSIDDILNPKGELDLADLCREMGLMED